MNVLTSTMTVMNDSPAPKTVTFEPQDRQFVYAIARRIVGTESDADDVAQEAMVLAFRNKDSFRGDSKYRTWLYRIALMAALGHLRQSRRASRRLCTEADGSHSVLDVVHDPTRSALDDMLDAEERRLLERALDDLSPEYRDVLLARLVASETEVSSRLGISLSNVKVRAHRARKQLRDVLNAA